MATTFPKLLTCLFSARNTAFPSVKPVKFQSTARMATAAKHVVNDPANLVVESLKGLATVNPEIKLDEASRGEFSTLWVLTSARGG